MSHKSEHITQSGMSHNGKKRITQGGGHACHGGSLSITLEAKRVTKGGSVSKTSKACVKKRESTGKKKHHVMSKTTPIHQ